VRVKVSNAIVCKNNRHTGATSVTFRAGIVQFLVRKDDMNRKDLMW